MMRTLKDLVFWLTNKAKWILGLKTGGGAAISGGDGVEITDDILAWFRTAFARDIENNFNGSHDSFGNAWLPLKYRLGKPLMLTGKLMSGAIQAAHQAQTGITVGNKMVINYSMSSPVYWKYHQYGTSRIPKRPFFDPSPGTLAELTKKIGQQVAVEFVK